ncbi:hypothetical protein [Ornithinimicrobium kibberense]
MPGEEVVMTPRYARRSRQDSDGRPVLAVRPVTGRWAPATRLAAWTASPS